MSLRTLSQDFGDGDVKNVADLISVRKQDTKTKSLLVELTKSIVTTSLAVVQ